MGWVKTEKTNKLSKLGDIDFTTTAPVDGNALVYDETNDVWVPGEGGGGNANEMVLTQDEYDALTPEEQLNGTNYYINDASVGAQSAAGTPYDNSLSDLLATDVQDAIDELVMGKVDAVNGKGLSTEDYTTAEKTKLSGIPNVPTPTTNDIDKVIKVESNGQGGAQYTLGVPTHNYSTTEQVVGTWIDGKTLYEKTVSVIITNESAQTLVTIADAEFKRIEGFLAIANQGAANTIIPVPYNDNTTLFVPYSDGDSVKLAKRNAGDRQGETIVLTLRYTKSST